MREIRVLQSELPTFLRETGYHIDAQHNIPILLEFLGDFSSFRRLGMRYYLEYRDVVVSFCDAIMEAPLVAIFGAGERGIAMQAFLYRNHFEGTCVFCDNNPHIQGTTVKGAHVYSLQEMRERFPNAHFVLVTPDYSAPMRCQLLSMGIPARRIHEAFFVYPHIAFELDWTRL